MGGFVVVGICRICRNGQRVRPRQLDDVIDFTWLKSSEESSTQSEILRSLAIQILIGFVSAKKFWGSYCIFNDCCRGFRPTANYFVVKNVSQIMNFVIRKWKILFKNCYEPLTTTHFLPLCLVAEDTEGSGTQSGQSSPGWWQSSSRDCTRKTSSRSRTLLCFETRLRWEEKIVHSSVAQSLRRRFI